MFKKILPLIFISLYVLLVFKPFFLQGKLPIPADTIVALYHPWRDLVKDQYPNGIPFENSLITDAVRQQYPWRNLAIEELKSGRMPTWNPYSFSGYPLLANIQSAVFYPLNVLYFVGEFSLIWSIQILLQSLLAGLFMYFYLKSKDLKTEAVVLGCLAWAGCGFMVCWLTANVMGHTVIWLPLILLSLEKIFNKQKLLWTGVFITSLLCSFLAGHLQSFFYLTITISFYSLWLWYKTKNLRGLFLVLICLGLFILLSFIVWFPALNFIFLSGRNIDQSFWQKEDWFIPWKHLVQFIAPDYFGNPATLNYFGIWNYAEFTGYVGLIPLFFAFLSIFAIKERKFFTILLFGALIMALPTVIGKIPYFLNIPFFSTAQPSRLLFLIDFTLAVLSVYGLDWFLSYGDKNKKKVFVVVGIFVLIFVSLWGYAFKLDYLVSLRNLILPTVILISLLGFLIVWFTTKRLRQIGMIILLIICLFDLSRFATKFLPFSSNKWLYPETKITRFLQDQSKNEIFRIASMDDRIMTPNFSTMYRLQSVGGYDPLYLSRYGEFIAALERNKANIDPPFGYGRQIQPHNYKNPLYNLLGVKYFLSLGDLNTLGVEKIMQEGETRVYENLNNLPRVFFVKSTIFAKDKQQAIDDMYDPNFYPAAKAIIEGEDLLEKSLTVGEASITKYLPSEIEIVTKNVGDGFLVFGDIYYPTWKATIDGIDSKIYLTNFTFRGIFIPKGEHKIRFFQ